MPTQGQALINMALLQREEQDRLESQTRRAQRRLGKKSKRAGLFGGLGKLGGAVIGNLLLPGVGGAIGASLLGRLGGEVGKKSVEDAEVGDGFLLNRLAAEDINRQLRGAESKLEKGLQNRMLTDAASGYMFGTSKLGDLSNQLFKGLGQNPAGTLQTLLGNAPTQGLQQVGQAAQMPFGGKLTPLSLKPNALRAEHLVFPSSQPFLGSFTSALSGSVPQVGWKGGF